MITIKYKFNKNEYIDAQILAVSNLNIYNVTKYRIIGIILITISPLFIYLNKYQEHLTLLGLIFFVWGIMTFFHKKLIMNKAKKNIIKLSKDLDENKLGECELEINDNEVTEKSTLGTISFPRNLIKRCLENKKFMIIYGDNNIAIVVNKSEINNEEYLNKIRTEFEFEKIKDV